MASRRSLVLFAACTALSPLAFGASPEAAYPAKPIHFIVPFSPGGESDVAARTIANRLSTLPGYTVIVDNYAGAGGNLGAEKALREPADGYTMLVISGAYSANAVTLKPAFDPIAAIQPVIEFSLQPSVLVSTPKWQSLGDLLAAARKAPGSINFGTAGVGSMGHLSTEDFAQQAHVKLNHIPYKGSSGAINDLAGGQIDMQMSGITAAESLSRSGKVRLLAISGDARNPAFPDVPTFAESGLPDFKAGLWHGLVASKDVPPAIVAKLNADINTVLRDPELKKRFATLNMTPVGGTPAQFEGAIRDDMKHWQQVVRDAGISAQ